MANGDGESLFSEILSTVTWDEYAMKSESLVITLGRVRQKISLIGKRDSAVGSRACVVVQTDIAYWNTAVGSTGIRPSAPLGILVQPFEGDGLVTLMSTVLVDGNRPDTWGSPIANLLEWQYYWFRRVALPNEGGQVRMALQDPGPGWDGGARADESLGKIQRTLVEAQPAFAVGELLQRIGYGVGLAEGYFTEYSEREVDIRLSMGESFAEFSVAIEAVGGWGSGLLLRHTIPLVSAAISAEDLNELEIAGVSGCAIGGAWTWSAHQLVFEQWLPLSGLTEDQASDNILNGIARLIWVRRLMLESPLRSSGTEPEGTPIVRLASGVQLSAPV